MRVERRAMKRLLILGVGSALMFTMAGMGSAQADTLGPIHKSTSAVANENQQVSVGGSRCAGCHRAHTAKGEKLLKQAQPALCYSCHSGAGGFLDITDGIDPVSGGALRGGGFEYALINGGAAQKTMPAVLDKYSHPASESVPVLAAGGPAVPESAVTSRHQIDGTGGTIWGNGAVSAAVDALGNGTEVGKIGIKLECASCHDPHGNGNYRILKPVPADSGTTIVLTAAVTTWTDSAVPPVTHVLPYTDTTVTPNVVHSVVPAVYGPAPVNIPDAVGPRVYTTGNYWAVADRNVPTLHATAATADPLTGLRTAGVVGSLPGTGATDGYITNIAAWCTTCHTRYLAGSGSYQTPLTSGSVAAGNLVTDATFTYRHRSDRADKEGLNVPNCIQCHVSHGSNVAMLDGANGSNNATYTAPDGTKPVLNSRLLRVDNRGTCEMCHNV